MKDTQESTLFQAAVNDCFGGSYSRAGAALGLTRSYVWKLYHGQRPMTPRVAESVDRATHGAFRKERILWPDPKREAA